MRDRRRTSRMHRSRKLRGTVMRNVRRYLTDSRNEAHASA
jgi:hypothetical protein